jgi:predicted dehydrogenase
MSTRRIVVRRFCPAVAFLAGVAFAMMSSLQLSAAERVQLMTLDPGHFHAALVQKSMYPQVDPVVHVYAPDSPDLDLHLQRIEGFNTRAEKPTRWDTRVYRGADFAEKMFEEKPGNVVVLSGNNAKKAEYILRCVQSGLNVLADKPMVITPDDFRVLQQAFKEAEKQKALLYDIMTERYEITTILQRRLSQMPDLFGEQDSGSPDQPAVTKESVHHFAKQVAGKPLIRPAWFFDVTQAGEGIVDVTSHLVDLIQWECFPSHSLKLSDVKVLSARRWPTILTPEQFEQVTGLKTFPDYLKPIVNADGNLEVYCNGEFVYTLCNIHAKVSVTWNFRAPEGAGDTHYSIMRGTKANLVIRQGAEQQYNPTLYVESPARTRKVPEDRVRSAVARLQDEHRGVEAKEHEAGWEIVIPDGFKVGHEAHFAQVTEAYLRYLADGKLPDWEVPNMLVKYHTIMEAYRLSRLTSNRVR